MLHLEMEQQIVSKAVCFSSKENNTLCDFPLFGEQSREREALAGGPSVSSWQVHKDTALEVQDHGVIQDC